MKVKKRYFRWLLYLGVTGIALFVLFFIAVAISIGQGVRENCARTQAKYEGDCVAATISFLKDEENPYGERNSAIWALGQLGDERALPVLKGYYTGDIPDREPWNEVISQYELSKAIKLLEKEGAFNITAPLWRFTLPE